MQKIISLDIGSYSIKALEMVNTFKTYQLTNFYEVIVPEIEEDDQASVLPKLLKQLFEENNIVADQIVTAMPGQYISYRILPFTYSDPKKIALTLEPTVEDLIPFDLDDMIVSHQILGTVKGSEKTNVLVVMTKKDFVSNFLKNLQQTGIDPKIIDVDSISLLNLSNLIEHPPEEYYGILDIGHEKTSLCIIQNKELKMFRTIYVGGKFLTEFIASELGLSYERAQQLKHEVEGIGDQFYDHNMTGESDEALLNMATERLTAGVDNIVNELVRTIYAFKQFDKLPISYIYLSGGTSNIGNIEKYISGFINIRVGFLNVIRAEDRTDILNAHKASVPQGTAIALRSLGSGNSYSKINLRKGEFSYAQNYEAILDRVKFFAKLAAAIILILGLNYGVKYTILAQKSGQIYGDILKTYKKSFPAVAKKASRLKPANLQKQASKKFREVIAEKKEVENVVRKSLNRSTVLEILSAISKNIDAGIKVDMERIKMSGIYVELKGDTNTFENATKIVTGLKESLFFKNVSEKKSYKKPGRSDVISFELLLTLKE